MTVYARHKHLHPRSLFMHRHDPNGQNCPALLRYYVRLSLLRLPIWISVTDRNSQLLPLLVGTQHVVKVLTLPLPPSFLDLIFCLQLVTITSFEHV